MVRWRRFLLLLLCAVSTFALEACGSAPQNCSSALVVTVTPSTATLNHKAPASQNRIQFVGIARAIASPGCPESALALREYASWSNPAPDSIQISSARDSTNGTAVCIDATQGPVTLTGTFSPVVVSGSPSGATDTSIHSVTLTCE